MERTGPNRVVVTGLGVISAIGNDRHRYWESLSEGRHGFREIELADTSTMQFHLGAEVRNADLETPFAPGTERLLDRFSRLWLLAAREAVRDSGASPSHLEDGAVVTGTGLGGQTTQDELFHSLYREGKQRLTAFAVPRIMSSAGASHASIELGMKGPGLTVSTACASSSHAIGMAHWMVSSGMAPVALCGGSEAPFSLGHLKAWDMMRAVSPDVCRPFSQGRKGLVLGEGAGALVLESLEHARSRGAHIHAEVLGFGMSSDATHITQPSGCGAGRAIASALKSARVSAESVEYVNAHGTGTPLNDATECKALRCAFRDHTENLMVSSTKSMHGHALGASGALEAVATVLTLENGVIPPTVNYSGPDPECALDVVPNTAREKRVQVAISNSFAFGGLNAVLVLGRWNGN
jgi:nodulation protein E